MEIMHFLKNMFSTICLIITRSCFLCVPCMGQWVRLIGTQYQTSSTAVTLSKVVLMARAVGNINL